ncbi:MAG: hypothetical protein E2O68_03265 [Deltaproteobacteria bacterium]|nr:MAG: hypothetical protein E2O68_03265 [Deltaproteobacteria bacterium]
MKKTLIGLIALISLTTTSYATYVPGFNPFYTGIPDSNKQDAGRICGYKDRWGYDTRFDRNLIQELKKIQSVSWIQTSDWHTDENGDTCLQIRVEQYVRSTPDSFKLKLTEKECERLEELQDYINTPGKVDFEATCLGKVLEGKIWVRK